MKKKLNRREKVLLMVLAMIVVVAAYVKLFAIPVGESHAAAQERLTQAQDALTQEQTRLMQMQKMQSEIDKLQSRGALLTAQVPDYDNIDNVMVQLDAILSTTAEYQLKFSDVQFGDIAVSRPVQLTFSAADYAAAEQVISNLYHCPYRCGLSDITVTTGTDGSSQGNVLTQKVSVSLTATFYEKYEDEAARQAHVKKTSSPSDEDTTASADSTDTAS